MAKTKNATPKKKQKRFVGLGFVKALCYILTLPVIVALAALICMKTAEGAANYSFWPWLGAIVAGLFLIIFAIVALIVNSPRARRKHNAMRRTASLLICCIILTGVFGVAFDVLLPDVIADATSKTLYVEDVYNNGIEKADAIKGWTRQFIRLNLVNGNYDGDLAYSTLKTDIVATDTDLRANKDFYQEEYELYCADIDDYNSTLAEGDEPKEKLTFADYWFDNIGKNFDDKAYTDLDREMYDFIYNTYIITDYDYALDLTHGRKAVCLAMVDMYSDVYAELVEEGIQSNNGFTAAGVTGNEKMSAIFYQNYAAMNVDGYLPFNDDAGLGYATNNRMTIPVVVRLILNDSYNYTQPVFSEDGTTIVDFDGFWTYSYNPEIAAQYTGEFSSDESTYGNYRGLEIFQATDGNYYYAYDDGHVDCMVNWCVLDMLGDPMPLTDDLLGMLGLNLDVKGLLESLGPIGTAVINTVKGGIGDLLNGGLTDKVIVTATDGQKLYLQLYFTDDGGIAITLVPQGIKYGYLGYQYMSWVQSSNLLVTICGLMSLRNLLYIFGAVSLVMIFAIGVINSHIEKKKEEAEKDGEEAPAEDAAPAPEVAA